MAFILCAPNFDAAYARGEDAPTLRRAGQSSVVRTTSYAYRYQDGQLLDKYGTIYGGDGEIKGYEEVHYHRNDKKKLQAIIRRYLNAREEEVRVHTTRYLYEGGRLIGADRFNQRAEGDQIHREEERYHVQVEGIGSVQENKLFDSDDELKQIRYTIVDKDDAGRMIARDTSTYDRDGQQSQRKLITYGRSRTGELLSETRVRFDTEDEIDHKEVAEYTRPSTDTMLQSWTQTKGDGEIEGYREVFYKKTQEGRTKSIETTYYGADGYATSTYYEEFAYDADGRIVAKRSHVDKY